MLLLGAEKSDDAWLPAGISAEPAYSLERDSANETLTVVAHLISPNAPRAKAGATWDKPRTITLGMMAAPAKPQPSNPASSARRWWPATAGTKDPRPAFKDDVVTAELIGNSQCKCSRSLCVFLRSLKDAAAQTGARTPGMCECSNGRLWL